jgi:hypothetical protein
MPTTSSREAVVGATGSRPRSALALRRWRTVIDPISKPSMAIRLASPEAPAGRRKTVRPPRRKAEPLRLQRIDYRVRRPSIQNEATGLPVDGRLDQLMPGATSWRGTAANPSKRLDLFGDTVIALRPPVLHGFNNGDGFSLASRS